MTPHGATTQTTPDPSQAAGSVSDALAAAQTQTGGDLLSMSRHHPLLVVFLRHFGCPFCREAVSDVMQRRERIEQHGVRIVFVHQSDDDQAAERFFTQYGAGTLARVSDPDRRLYEAFALRRATPTQLSGPKVWWRGVTAMLRGHVMGKVVGDVFQMPGVFLVHDGRIVEGFRHRSQADRPDYEALASCPVD